MFAGTGIGLVVSTSVTYPGRGDHRDRRPRHGAGHQLFRLSVPGGHDRGRGGSSASVFPSLWFQNISIGTFAKGRPFADFHLEFLMLFAFGIGFLTTASLLLKKQER